MHRRKTLLVNSTRTQSVLNQTLTNYAFGLEQDVRSSIADFLAPPTPVGVSIGQYKSFSEKNAFVIYSTQRALGGPATRVAFAASDSTFNCLARSISSLDLAASRSSNAVRAPVVSASIRAWKAWASRRASMPRQRQPSQKKTAAAAVSSRAI